MPDLKISQLPVASATTGAELFPVVQGGVTKQIALNAVRHIGSAVFDANGSMAVDTNTLFVDAANNGVGFGTLTPSSRAHAVVADGSYSIAGSGTTRGFRVEHNTTETRIVGVDNTLTGSFQPLSLGGSTVLVRTNGSTLAATFDASGNLGLGVTPSAWATANGQKALQITTLTALWTGANGAASLGFNAYESGVNAYTYSTTNPSSLYAQGSGEHRWFTAPSGTAGNAISFTQAMTLTAGGNLLVGSTTDSGARLSILGGSLPTNSGLHSLYNNATSSGRLVSSVSSLGVVNTYLDDSTLEISTGTTNTVVSGIVLTGGGAGVAVPNVIRFYTASTERARITAGGSVVVGTAALATTATDGFLYVPTCAGTPTGVPTTQTGTAAIVINTTNNKLYFYSGGAWRDAGP